MLGIIYIHFKIGLVLPIPAFSPFTYYHFFGHLDHKLSIKILATLAEGERSGLWTEWFDPFDPLLINFLSSTDHKILIVDMNGVITINMLMLHRRPTARLFRLRQFVPDIKR